MSDKTTLRQERLNARRALENIGKVNFKPLTSAKWTDVERTWTGMLHVRIEHDDIHGCTPAMLRWWFENLGRETTWDGIGFNGPPVSFYHLWHHRDHIAIQPITGSSRGFAPGQQTRVSEQFNDFHEKIDSISTTDRLDDSEFTFTVKLFGILPVCRVIHMYSAVKGGSRFYSETVIGTTLPVLGLFINWILMPFIYSFATAENWIKHNIEETGRSEDIISVLYKHYDGDQSSGDRAR